MIKSYALIITAFSLCRFTLQDFPPELECGESPGNSDRTIKISLSSRRNETGEWVDTLIARMESSNSSDHLHFDVTHRVTECDGKRVVHIKGVTKDTSVEENEGKLKFHQRSGTNIAVSNKGLTIQRINLDDSINSAAFTNRPLRNNEMFEVRVDKKITKFSWGSGIGVTTVSPADVQILPEMWRSPNVWMYYDQNVYSNGRAFLHYKATDIQNIQVGERIGVMRNEFGVLHFFLNGVDQGPAVSNVPQTVYGVFDLRHNAVKATIVYTSNSSST